MRIGTLTFCQIAALLMIWFWGNQAQATVIFQDDFEAPLTSRGWTTDSCVYMGYSAPFPADGCNPTRSTDIAHSGSHSLKGDYTGACNLQATGRDCGVWITNITSAMTERWDRWYMYTNNFTYDPIQTKQIYIYTTSAIGEQYPTFIYGHQWGNRTLWTFIQNEVGGTPPCTPANGNYTTCNYPDNMSSVPMNNGQWYCVETHLKMNTPGSPNGIEEAWVNGVQIQGYYDRQFVGPDVTNPNGNSSTAKFFKTKIFVQAGQGLMYYDDYALGDTRIGCGTAPTSDATPPSAPMGLSVR